MTADAALQLRRLLHAIPKLSDGKAHSVDEVARVARTDRNTVLRDLFSLTERLHEPGGFVPGLQVYIDSGQQGVRIANARHFRRPMGLTLGELSALQLGLAMLRTERTPSECATIDRARDRLRKAVARLPTDEWRAATRHAELGAGGEQSHLSIIRDCIRKPRKARIKYRTASAEESRVRVICPYGLIASRGAWYLVAHADDRDAVRIFRFDRIEEVKQLTSTFDAPEPFAIGSVVHDGRVFRADHTESLRVRYSPVVARWIAEREQVTLDADGSVTVEYPLADVEWAIRHVLQYGADAEVLAPEAVRTAVIDRLRGIVAGSARGATA
jgi:predicted DNA-binding transcriptional regulator YafY